MIKAITFDLDGVYFTSESFKSFKSKLPKKVTDPIAIDQVFHHSLENKQFRRGECSEDDFWAYVKLELGITLTNEEIFQFLADCYQVDPQVVEIVKKIRSLGYKTCICTNNYPTRIRVLNQKFNFLKNFDIHIFSYQVGVIKPDPKIFQALITATGYHPSEIAYSDDRVDNVTAAQKLGINSFTYQDFAGFINRLKTLGVAI